MRTALYIVITAAICWLAFYLGDKPRQAHAVIGAWNYNNPSQRVMYNLHNPSADYEQYTPLPGRPMRTGQYTPRPFCWNCHGSGEYIFANGSTMAWSNYSAIQHSR